MSRFDGSYDGSANSFVDRKLFIGALSHNVTEDDIRQYFSTQGEVESVSLTFDRTTGKSKGHAFVVMARNEDYERILTTDHRLQGRLMNISKAVKMREVKYSVDNPQSSTAAISVDSLLALVSAATECRVNLTGIQECTTEGIKDYFRHFGDVSDVAKTQHDLATITFVKPEDAEKVLRQTTHYVFGKMIQAKPFTENSNISGNKRPMDGFKEPGIHTFVGNSQPGSNDGYSYVEDKSGSSKMPHNDAYNQPTTHFSDSYNSSSTATAPQAYNDSRVPAAVAAKHTTEGRRIFVGNLRDISLKEVTDYFETFGPMEHAEFKHDELGNFKGFGFISFKSDAVVNAVLAQPHWVNGVKLFVNLATQRRSDTSSGHTRDEKVPSGAVSATNYDPDDPYGSASAVAAGSDDYYRGGVSSTEEVYRDYRGSDQYQSSAYYESNRDYYPAGAVAATSLAASPAAAIVGDKDYRSIDEVLASVKAVVVPEYHPPVDHYSSRSVAAPVVAAARDPRINNRTSVDPGYNDYRNEYRAAPSAASFDSNAYGSYSVDTASSSRDYIPPHKLAAVGGAAGSYSNSRDYVAPHKRAENLSSRSISSYESRDYVPPQKLAAVAGLVNNTSSSSSYSGGSGYQGSRDYVPPHVLAKAEGGNSGYAQYESRDYVPPHKLAAAAAAASEAYYASHSAYDNSRGYVPRHKLAAVAGIVNGQSSNLNSSSGGRGGSGSSGGGYGLSRDYIPPQKLAAVAGVTSNSMGGVYESRDYIPPHKLASVAGLTTVGYDHSRDYVPPYKLAAAAAGGVTHNASANGVGAVYESRDYIPPHKLAASAAAGGSGYGNPSGYEGSRDYVPPYKLAAAVGLVNNGSGRGGGTAAYQSRDYIPPSKLAAAAGLVHPAGYDSGRDYLPPHKLAASAGLVNNQQVGSTANNYDSGRDYIPPHKLAAMQNNQQHRQW